MAGVWLEDLLADSQRLWLMDEAFETGAAEDLVVGLRAFDAEWFHVGFGVAVRPDAATVALCLAIKARGWSLPAGHSLTVILYGDQLRADRGYDAAQRARPARSAALKAGAAARSSRLLC